MFRYKYGFDRIIFRYLNVKYLISQALKTFMNILLSKWTNTRFAKNEYFPLKNSYALFIEIRISFMIFTYLFENSLILVKAFLISLIFLIFIFKCLLKLFAVLNKRYILKKRNYSELIVEYTFFNALIIRRNFISILLNFLWSFLFSFFVSLQFLQNLRFITFSFSFDI